MARAGSNASRKAMLLAVVMGLVSAAMIMNYLKQATAVAKPVEMVEVVVAQSDLPARTLLTKEMLKTQQVPAEFRHGSAVSSIDEAEGKILRMPVAAGETLLTTKFITARQEGGLAFIIPPKKRAVAVAVSEVIGSGSMILPGDFVDVVGVFDDKMMGKDTALFVLQNIEVLAVAQRREGADSESLGAEISKGAPNGAAGTAAKSASNAVQPGLYAGPRTVTLAVSPDQAERLVLAEERGKLRLALRAYKDSEIARVPEATMNTIREMATR